MKLKFKITLLVLMLVNIFAFAQEKTLTGSVTSEGDNSPLPGVSITILKTSNGVQTDFNGNFIIKVKNGDVLQFSYLGFKSLSVIIDGQKTLNVILTEDVSSLDEIIVVGYGTQKKSHLTGAISKVKNEKLDQIAVARGLLKPL